MTKKWAAFPYPGKGICPRCRGTQEGLGATAPGSNRQPLPKDPGALEAWRHYHAGEFAAAVAAGRKAGGVAVNAAVKAQMIHANYLARNAEKAKLALLEEAGRLGRRAAARSAPRMPTRTTCMPIRLAVTAKASRSPRPWRKDTAAGSRRR